MIGSPEVKVGQEEYFFRRFQDAEDKKSNIQKGIEKLDSIQIIQ
jgi:hypothetical protein